MSHFIVLAQSSGRLEQAQTRFYTFMAMAIMGAIVSAFGVVIAMRKGKK